MNVREVEDVKDVTVAKQGTAARITLAIGLAGALLGLIGWIMDGRQFLQSYLFAFIFWVEPALGCLGFLMLHHLVGGKWGNLVRRFLEAGSLTLPLMAVFFLPIAFGLRDIYPWAVPGAMKDELLRHKAPYLNGVSFCLRSLLYFLIWAGLAWRLTHWSGVEARKTGADAEGAEDARRRMRVYAAPGLILFAFAGNFASFDWTMSLEPRWYSTLYGFLFLAQAAPATLSLLILSAVVTERKGFLSRVMDPSRFSDLGSLLLAFLVIWIYASFFQYMLIWYGNLPEEISWYVHRNAGGWKWIARFFVVFYFAVPFGILLFRSNRSSPRTLAWLGIGLQAVHLVYVFWFVTPSFRQDGFALHWLDVAVWAGMGGLWGRVYLGALARRPVFAMAEEDGHG